MTIEATRREVLHAGAAGGVALWIVSSPVSALAAPAPVGAGAPYLRRSAYSVGIELVARGSVLLRVEAVDDLDHAAERGLAGSDDAFALLLSGDAATALEQGVHGIEVPGAGAGELFLVPVGAPAERRLYEIVVDRSVRLAGFDAPSPAAGAAAATAAAAPAPAAPETGDEEPAVAPDPRYAFLRSVSVRRGRPGLRAGVRVAKKSKLKRVSVQVVRDGAVLAQGAADVRRNKALVGLRMRAPVARGSRYDIVVTGVDRRGVRTVVRRSGIVR